MSLPISLIPLTSEHHADALQEVYAQTPSYWQMYNLPSVTPKQAERDLNEAHEVDGRTMLGIAQRVERTNPDAGAMLIGLVDFRLNWPEENVAYLGMIMVAEPLQRQGIGRKAWRMLMQWLLKSTDVTTVRLGVEQFNPSAMQFFQNLDFQLTGDANRIQSGDKFVRLLYMENDIASERVTHERIQPQ